MVQGWEYGEEHLKLRVITCQGPDSMGMYLPGQRVCGLEILGRQNRYKINRQGHRIELRG